MRALQGDLPARQRTLHLSSVAPFSAWRTSTDLLGPSGARLFLLITAIVPYNDCEEGHSLGWGESHPRRASLVQL